MEKKREGNLLVIRLTDGEDLLAMIRQAVAEEKITSGIVLGGVGMIRNAALSFYAGRGQYETVPLATESELCSLDGNVSRFEDEIVVHLHAVVGRRGGDALAGHLSSAVVNMTAEIAILAAPQKLIRKEDPETGLKTLTFE